MFTDRREAGRLLGRRLRTDHGSKPGRTDIVVVGLPRGGVPVAAEVAEAIGAPLDVIIVRKLGVPYHQELGMGAIGEDGVRVLNQHIIASAGVTESELREVERRERVELDRRADRFRGNRARLPLSGKTVIVVDDGIATGSTARAACEVARAEGAARVVLAVPVAPVGWVERLDGAADDYVALDTPRSFAAIGQFYEDFRQTSDAEVVDSLRRTTELAPEVDEDVVIDLGPARLHGHLTVPAGHFGVVVFAHGSGSSRHSPRNLFVASTLQKAGFATLLFDLLTANEEADRRKVFDIGLLAGRLSAATSWLRGRPGLETSPLGYFGASTGAAAALWAAADPDVSVDAIVSRGGRPDLAGPRLPDVTAPTLLIVGGDDTQVLELNRQAAAAMQCPNRVWVVPDATHLFSEPGALEAVADLAKAWFAEHLAESHHSAR